MPKVYCCVACCAHNLGSEICNAAVIEINADSSPSGEETDCSTYIPRDFAGSLLSLDNVNYSGLVAQAFSGRPAANPQIRCEISSCRFNDGGQECLAEKVSIFAPHSHSSTETVCSTYRK